MSQDADAAMSALRLLVRSGKPAQLGAGHAAALLDELERLRAIERRVREFHGERTRAGRYILDI